MQENSKGYPFRDQPGKEIGRGTPWGESKVLEHGEDWVIKETVNKGKNTVQRLQQNKEDYEFFLERLKEYVPETQFIRGNNNKGESVNLVRQRRVKGKRISDFSNEEIQENRLVIAQLIDFFEKCIRMWDEDGRIPDLKAEGGPLHTGNLMIADETQRLFLVDTSAPARFFSKKSFFIFRRRCQGTVNEMKNFVEQYKKFLQTQS